MNPPQILVPLAHGFEEIEAIVPIDLWRRAGFHVLTAGLLPGPIEAARLTRHLPDDLLSNLLDRDFDLIYLPGGRPGADHLRDCQPLLQRLQRQDRAGLRIAAICAAPLALEAAGLLHGKRWTGHPTIQGDIPSGTCTNQPTEVSGTLLTARSAGVAAELAFLCIDALAGPPTVQSVQAGFLANPLLLQACRLATSSLPS